MSSISILLELLFVLSSVATVAAYGVVVLAHSFFHTSDRRTKWASTFAMCSTAIAFPVFLATFCAYNKLNITMVGTAICLFLALAVIELLRIVLDGYEIRKRNILPPSTQKSNVANVAGNLTLYLGMYTATLYSDRLLFAGMGYLMCAFNLVRVLKYRLYDDFAERKVSITGSWLVGVDPGAPPPPSHITLFQGLYNVFIRTYFFVSTTYVFMYLILVSNDLTRVTHVFKYEHGSGILFVDFLYYSIFQLALGGYGDIAPISVAAKLLSISEMLFGYLVLGSILALIFSSTTGGRQSDAA